MSEQPRRHYYPLVLAAVVIGLIAAFGTRAAAVTEYAAPTSVQVGSTTLQIRPGSAQDSLTVSGGVLTVSVPAGEAFELRSPYASRVNLENDAQLSACNVINGSKDNQLFIRGPRVVNVTPGSIVCSTANAATNVKPVIIASQPEYGASLASGQSYQLFWQNDGWGALNVTIKLSADGGASYPHVVAENIVNDGFYQWTVPDIVSTDHARLKFYGLDAQGGIVALAVGPADFRIEGSVAPEPEEPEAPAGYDYDREEATRTAATIDIDKGFSLPAGSPAPECAGMRIKSGSGAAVYFCGADGKRHAFPNQKVHDSWYAGDFAAVVTVSDAFLASVPLGPNVTYRPGVRLVKIQTDPKVYAVAADGVLRWVPSEEAALALYGADWNRMVDDVPDAFFADYTIGEPIYLK